MSRDFWRGALSAALVLGTLSFLDSVGSEPLPGWTKSPRDLDLPPAKRAVDKPRQAARRDADTPVAPEPPVPPEFSMALAMAEELCPGDCQEYGAGFAWAAMRAVSDSRQCPDRGEAFVDGCEGFVAHMRGEDDDSENDSGNDDSDDEDHNRR